ncbi:MAG TPA: heme-binding domain-containing protein [bacterium]|nr:heme-binding domain-containing protein [bacterium]HNE82516.1 heme-binding domain-containing protein [bacterium]HNJ71055.1 heme-binding domain-containing protein [bacterium]HNM14737.1 heme-binding domain-containing protein [bacterium]HNO10065.1 heme-binding domain-containing protein [bacterium]
MIAGVRFKRILISLLMVFFAIQFIQPARNESGQAVGSELANAYAISDTIDVLLKQSCYDCHSNHTAYPWYSYIQPIGWLIAKDIQDGKAKLNFSELGALSHRRQLTKLQMIENQIKDGTMPLQRYVLLHKDACLTGENKLLILEWISKIKDTSP